MIILDKPYCSPFLAKTLVESQVPVVTLGNIFVPFENNMNRMTPGELYSKLQEKDDYPLLANSENAFVQLEKHLPDSPLIKNISIFKNKALFRRWLKQVYPSFFFLEISSNDISRIKPSELPFPVIIKPAVGYASLGVHRVADENEWNAICKLIETEIQLSSRMYPDSVFDSSTFIIEEWIQGSEYAVDAYFSETGEPVVLNVFKRMFLNDGDTSDRIYFTSKQVLEEALPSIQSFLDVVKEKANLTNFPIHMEIRIKDNKELIPIEVNPLRFAGIGTTELGFHAYGINPYESFIKQHKPDWKQIISSMDDAIYSFFCADIPTSIDPDMITSIDLDELQKHFQHVLHSYALFPKDPRTFAVLFYRSENLEENKKLLELDLAQFLHSRDFVTT